MRMKLSEWAEKEYSEQSRPHITTLRRMAVNGEIPGAVQTTTNRWFVVVNEASNLIDNRLKEIAEDDPIMKKAMGL